MCRVPGARRGFDQVEQGPREAMAAIRSEQRRQLLGLVVGHRGHDAFQQLLRRLDGLLVGVLIREASSLRQVVTSFRIAMPAPRRTAVLEIIDGSSADFAKLSVGVGESVAQSLVLRRN
jgi:hypothetical protein